MKIKILTLCLWIVQITFVFYITIAAQSRITPIEKSSYNQVTSHSEMLEFLTNVDNSSDLITLEYIGQSVEGRDIPIIHYLNKCDEKKIKILIVSQQHGNEPSGKEAALLLINKLANSENAEAYKNLDLLIIPSLNPDGNESAKRTNANKEDLNRNHLLLTEPEVIALHKIFNEYMPEVTLDVHEYSAYRKSFLEVGYVRSTEEQFGALTNLNIAPAIISYQLKELFSFLETDLNSKNVSFSNYYKINNPIDTVRSSTAGIIDGRQSFGILSTFSLILEGKNGKSFNSDLERRSNDQLHAIESFLNFVNDRSKEIKLLVEEEREKLVSLADSVIIQMDYEFTGEFIDIPIQMIPSLKDTSSVMHFSPKIKKLKSVSRPSGYIIPNTQTSIVSLLDKHNIEYEVIDASVSKKVEIYSIDNIEEKHIENKKFKVATTSKRLDNYICQKGDIIIPINQLHNTMLAIALEPESMWGLFQSELFEDLLQIGKDYPILRLVKN